MHPLTYRWIDNPPSEGGTAHRLIEFARVGRPPNHYGLVLSSGLCLFGGAALRDRYCPTSPVHSAWVTVATDEHWSSRYGRDVSVAEGQEMTRRLADLVCVLAEIDLRLQREART